VWACDFYRRPHRHTTIAERKKAAAMAATATVPQLYCGGGHVGDDNDGNDALSAGPAAAADAAATTAAAVAAVAVVVAATPFAVYVRGDAACVDDTFPLRLLGDNLTDKPNDEVAANDTVTAAAAANAAANAASNAAVDAANAIVDNAVVFAAAIAAEMPLPAARASFAAKYMGVRLATLRYGMLIASLSCCEQYVHYRVFAHCSKMSCEIVFTSRLCLSEIAQKQMCATRFSRF
jgi:hypothetical protein